MHNCLVERFGGNRNAPIAPAPAPKMYLFTGSAHQNVNRFLQAASLTCKPVTLTGKHKTIYTPHIDTGDYIVVINAEKIAVTGNKLNDKMYHRFTGHIGNFKSVPLKEVLAGPFANRAIEFGVRRMMPKGPLGRDMLRKLKVYTGTDHPHTAQQPQALSL